MRASLAFVCFCTVALMEKGMGKRESSKQRFNKLSDPLSDRMHRDSPEVSSQEGPEDNMNSDETDPLTAMGLQNLSPEEVPIPTSEPTRLVDMMPEKAIDHCAPFNPCLNMATCTSVGDSFHCLCPEGYQGYACGEHDCESNTAGLIADIVFLLDSSGSIGRANFEILKNFTAQFAEAFNIGQLGVQIGVVTFSDTVHNHFNLSEYDNKAELVNAIYGIRFEYGVTNTHKALKYVRQNSFLPATGDRLPVGNVLIVITDGGSFNQRRTLEEATELHLDIKNIKVIAIGLVDEADMYEVEIIASDSDHVFQVTAISELYNIQRELQKKACLLV